SFVCKVLVANWIRDANRTQRLRSYVPRRRRDSAQGFWISPVLPMADVTRILSAIEHGDPQAAVQLLPLVYAELRKLAAQKLAHEKPGQTLDATALVHEAYLRLVGTQSASAGWDSRSHFFAAAAEAMRRILVEAARRKRRIKHGGGRVREREERHIALPPDTGAFARRARGAGSIDGVESAGGVTGEAPLLRGV